MHASLTTTLGALGFGLCTAAGLTAQAGTLASSTAYGAGCTSSTGRVLRATATLPVLGQAISWQLDSSAPNASSFLMLGFQQLSLPLDPFGARGCTLLVVATDAIAATSDSVGRASVSANVPTDPRLDGARLFSQWAQFDLTANQLGVTASNGIASVLGVLPQAVITGISATTLNAGDTVRLQGTELGLPLDTCLMVMDPATGDFARLKPDRADPTRFVVTRVPAGGIRDGVLGMIRGRGARPAVPGTTRLSAPGEAWAWDGLGFQQNRAALPGITINPPPPMPPVTTVDWTVDTVNNCVVCTLPPLACAILVYNPGAKLTTDVHPDVLCNVNGVKTHYDFFLESVTVVAGTPVFYGQVALEHAAQVQSQLDLKYGVNKFTVVGNVANGQMKITYNDPNCVFTGPNGRKVGKTIVDC